MQIPDEILDKIFKEMMEEYKLLAEKTKDEKPTFHNLEGATLKLGKEFEKRILKAALEEERKKNSSQKKNAWNVEKLLPVEG